MQKVGHPYVRAARVAVVQAEAALYDALRVAYPLKTTVTVHHARGKFSGVVVGWDVFNRAVVVNNTATNKSKAWHFEQVEIVQ